MPDNFLTFRSISNQNHNVPKLGAAFLVLGMFLFGFGNHLMQETADHPVQFNAIVYSIDSFVPLIDFHQERYWLPNADAGAFAVRGVVFHWGQLLRIYHWLHIAVGWFVSFCIVAGLTGIVRKN